MHKLLLGMLLLTATAAAQAPEDVVDRFYRDYLRTKDEDKTIVAQSRCFTPGFYSLLDRVLRLEHQKESCYGAFFVVGNGGWGDYELGRATVDGNSAIVPLTLWCGLRSDAVRTDAKLRRKWDKTYGDVYLTNLGSGWQIYDLKFLRHVYSKNDVRPATSARFAANALLKDLSKPAK